MIAVGNTDDLQSGILPVRVTAKSAFSCVFLTSRRSDSVNTMRISCGLMNYNILIFKLLAGWFALRTADLDSMKPKKV